MSNHNLQDSVRESMRVYFDDLGHLAGFAVRHPDVKLEFALDDGLADIVAERFDAGMRMSDTIEADMVAVPIGGPNRMITVAAPDYLTQRPPPRSVEDQFSLLPIWTFSSVTPETLK